MRAFGVDVDVTRPARLDWPEGATRAATGGLLVVERHPQRGFLVDGGDLGRHVVAPDGRSVEVEGEAGALLTGQTLPLAATLQGRACLHASAVVLGGEAVAFVGGPGAGKSTLANALVAEGAELLTDDVLALEGPRAHPGPTSTRAEAAVLAHPGPTSTRAEAAVLAHPGPTSTRAEAARVTRVYVLDRGAREAPAVELLLAAAFVGWLRDREVQVALLDACSALASSARVERLSGTPEEALRAVRG